MAAGNIWSFYSEFSAKIACIWLCFWAIRKKADVHYPLDGVGRIVRWTLVAVGFAVVYYVASSGLGYLRVAGMLVALAFLCWPNLAFYLRNLFKTGRSNGPNLTD